jgi:VanZ family protein
MARRFLLSPIVHAVLYAAFIFVLSALPDPPVLGPMPINDKIKHFALYAVFTVLVVRALAQWVRSPIRLAVCTVLLVSLYGASDEYHQRFTPGRSCDARDWLADTLSAATVCAILPAAMFRGSRKRLEGDY